MSYSALNLAEVDFESHASWIELAKNGNILAAKGLMGDASILIRHGVALTEPLASYIGEALYKSAVESEGGEEPNRAFNMAKARGRNPGTEKIKAFKLCLEVEKLHRNGLTYEKAYEEIPGYGDSKSVKRTYLHERKKSPQVAKMSDDEIEYMINAIIHLLGIKTV